MDLSMFTESPLQDHGLLDNVSWLDANWMFLSLGLGIVVALWLVLSPTWPGSLKQRLRDPRWWAFMAAPVYAVQQFEEHGFDIFGRRFMFVPVYNAGTGEAMGIEMAAPSATLINIALVWGAFPLWAYFSNPKNGYYPATFAWGFSIMNGIVGHLIPFFAVTGELRYVPGLAQVVFMLPLGFWILLVVFRQHGVFAGTVVPLILGVVFHLIGLIGPELFFRWIPNGIREPLFIGLMAILPLLVMPLVKRALRLGEWRSATRPAR